MHRFFFFFLMFFIKVTMYYNFYFHFEPNKLLIRLNYVGISTKAYSFTGIEAYNNKTLFYN